MENWTSIPLFSGNRWHKTRIGFTKVSVVDLPKLSGRSFHLSKRGYPARGDNVPMHRLVLGLSPHDGHVVDHINRDKLDNRRENLRITTQAVNTRNLGFGAKPARRPDIPQSSHRGVSWNVEKNRWRANARLGGRQHHLGYFDDERDAAAAVRAFWLAVDPVAV